MKRWCADASTGSDANSTPVAARFGGSARTHGWRATCRTSGFFLPFFFVIGKTPVVGLASPQDGVDRRVERALAVIDCARSAILPFDIAVWPGDVTVGARGHVDNDLSPCFHGTISDSVANGR